MEQNLVKATIQGVVLGQPGIGPEKIPHRAALIPLPVKTPFTARINQLIADQDLKHMQPAGPLPRRLQPTIPELIQTQLVPQITAQPASSPLPRPTKTHLTDPDADHIAVKLWRMPIFGKQRHLFRYLITLIEDLDRLAPRSLLAIVDFTQIQHMPLHRSTARHPAVFNHAPIAVFLAILLSRSGSQEHAVIVHTMTRTNKILGLHRK